MNPATPQPARISTDRLSELRDNFEPRDDDGKRFWGEKEPGEIHSAFSELIAAREASALAASPAAARPSAEEVEDAIAELEQSYYRLQTAHSGRRYAICAPVPDTRPGTYERRDAARTRLRQMILGKQP
jgi:hypothetical protein